MPTSDHVYQALLLAVERHAGQFRAGSKSPYVVHPIRVARLAAATARAQGLSDHEVDRIELAAFLHDTLEDTTTTYEELALAFSAQVADIVLELTQDMTLEKPERRRRMLAKAGAMSFEARMVKLADRLDNVREMDALGEAFVDTYATEALVLVRAMRGTAPAIEEAILELVREKTGRTLAFLDRSRAIGTPTP